VPAVLVEPRYAKPIDRNQRSIIDAAESLGCKVFVLLHPVDLLVEIGGRLYLWEVKRPGKAKQLTNAQREFRRRWTFATIETEADVAREVGRILEEIECPRSKTERLRDPS
jgi:hypothetical protein